MNECAPPLPPGKAWFVDDARVQHGASNVNKVFSLNVDVSL